MTISKSIKTIALCTLMLLVVVFGFAACALPRLTDNPGTDDIVTGNGGIAVQKGDYLYFTNGYINTADVGDTNEYGNIDVSAIYRVKLTDGRVTEKNVEYNDEGVKKVDKTQALNDIEIIVPKVAGFEYSDLYIFGDYIYYTTPNHLRDREQTVLSNQLNFYRTRLDRSGSNELLYTSLADNTSVSMTMYEVDGVVYQIILDDQTLMVISIDENNRVTKTEVSDTVNDASMPKYANSTDEINAIDHKIYYTEPMENDGVGTTLKAFDLATKESTTIYNNYDETYVVIGTRGNYLYFTLATSSNPGSSAHICAVANDNFNNKVQISDRPVSDDGITAYQLVSQENSLAILYTDGTKTFFKRANAESIVIANSDILTNVVAVQGDIIYYVANSTLNSLVYTSAGNAANSSLIPSADTPKSDIAKNFDVDGTRVFYFVQYTENYYMHYADSSIVDFDTNETYYHFIGSLIEADYLNVDEDGNLVEDTESTS